MRPIAKSLAAAVALVSGACHGPSASDQARAVARAAAPPAQRPLRILIVPDQTCSMYTAGVGLPDGDSLRPLLPRLEEAGGELAVGAIRDGAGFPLRRLFVPAPPPAPRAVPDRPDNIFEAAHARQHEAAEQADYNEKHRAWLERVRRQESIFIDFIGRYLATQPASRSDLRSAVLRANLFFSEPNLFTSTSRNVVIFITDGKDNVNPKPLDVGLPADVIVVCGPGSAGYLEPLHPGRFESFDAAVRFVVSAPTNQGERNVRR